VQVSPRDGLGNIPMRSGPWRAYLRIISGYARADQTARVYSTLKANKAHWPALPNDTVVARVSRRAFPPGDERRLDASHSAAVAGGRHFTVGKVRLVSKVPQDRTPSLLE